MTLEEIGETFDLTRERVRQIKEKQLKIKTYFKK
jgi:DNA-directed RNA polymerase sigma subunit (sigma70/sigma32)